MMSRVSERVAMLALALLTALAVVAAPWGAVNRETGARSAVVLLPDRIVDFTGRTDPVELPAQGTVFVLTLIGLAGVVAGAALKDRARFVVWMVSGLVLVAGTAWGVNRFYDSVSDARVSALVAEVQRAIDNPRPNVDVDQLRQVVVDAPDRSLSENIAAADDAVALHAGDGVGEAAARHVPYGAASDAPAVGFSFHRRLVSGCTGGGEVARG